ncbi:MAG TPA: isoprenylcysteine carboxylmethyltransferase family protein [Pirellulaceae bacterium]|nr:isoprenylcysteine carboxylmethyltransferase family protein [Pirellulaceae bacterium]
MTDDQLFRFILLAGFLITLPIAIYHRVRAHTGEPLDRRQEGWLLLIAIRVLGGVGMLAALALAFASPSWMTWSIVPLPTWIRWLGVGLGCFATGLLIWTFRTLGKNITDTVVTRREHTLVTSGPYRWVRHPFYVAFLLGMTAIAIVLANWLLLMIGIAAFTLLAIRSRKEEANLELRFGDNYRRYREQTEAFYPRLFG